MGICEDCSTESGDSGETCKYCGGKVIPQSNPQRVPKQIFYPRKSPVYGFLFSLPFPGFADIYAGNMLKGFTFLVITYSLYSLIPFGPVLHVYLVLNSWRVVTKYNITNQRTTSLTLVEQKIIYYLAIIAISTMIYFLVELVFF